MGTAREPRFGIIGTGGMAAAMVSTFRRARVPVIAVASRDEARARRFGRAFGIADAHGEWSSLLGRADIEAVYVANATVDHAEAAVAALEAGKAVLCEKPLALDASGGKRVVEAARRSGRLCMEGLWTAFLPAQRRFVELAQQRACGEPRHLFADFGYPESARPRLLAPAAGGVLLDRGVYLVALALKTLGPVSEVTARLDIGPGGVDRHASLGLSHAAGGHSQLAASFTANLSNTAWLAGSEGLIRLEEPLIGSEAVSLRREPPRTPGAGEAAGLKQRLAQGLRRHPLLRRLKRALPDASRQHLPYGPDAHLPELEHFVGLLKAGARESDVVPLEFSLDVLRVLDRARRSQTALAGAQAS